jgi:hypothetical protein
MSDKIYHGSMFDVTELKPAFQITKTLVRWDHTESNKFLYATKCKDEAIDQGFFSMMSLTDEVDEIHSDGKNIVVISKNPNKLIKLGNKPIYVYELELSSDWTKVNNQHNGLGEEYKTKKTISDILSKEKIEFSTWIKNKHVSFEPRKSSPKFLDWK